MDGAAADLGTSLAVALLAWALGVATTRLREAFARRKLNRHFQLSGRYVTSFEDTEDGQVSWHHGVSVLEQRGSDVVGATVENGARGWRLAGRVETGGFVHGVYSASDPHDRGQGTFFLEIEELGGDLSGLWAGYDSVDGRLDQGRYLFRRCAAERVDEVTADGVDDVVALMAESLGDAYVTAKSVEEARTDPMSLCLVARDRRGVVIGALTASIVGDLAEHAPAGKLDGLVALRPVEMVSQVLLIRSVAVREAVRGRAVAGDLVRAAIGWGSRRGARIAVAFAWVSASRGCHAAGVLGATGFAKVAEVAQFWHDESVALGYGCVECGRPCVCDAEVHVRNIASNEGTDEADRVHGYHLALPSEHVGASVVAPNR